MISRLAAWSGVVCSTILLSGCNSTAFTPAVPADINTPASTRAFSPAEQSVAVNAIREWHRAYATEGMMYELDRYDRRIGRGLRNALRDICPALSPSIDREDLALFTVTVDQIHLPQGNYAYAVIQVGNRFETEEYAFVYEYRNQDWVLLDQYLIAKGLMDVVMVDFSWTAYCREKGIPLPTAATTPAPLR